MTIVNAITFLELLDRSAGTFLNAAEIKALKLGIEAMKRVQLQRGIWGMEHDALLPGETKE
ncbi:hypothetical protein ES708_05170 [subsurface metagenome]